MGNGFQSVVDFDPFIECRKQICMTTHRFGRAQHQYAIGFEGIMKYWNDLLLQGRLEVD